MTKSTAKRIAWSLVVVLVWLLTVIASPPVERVSVKVTVNVTDDKGKPVPNAAIVIGREGEKNNNGKPVSSISGNTDQQGRFSTTGEPKFFELSGKPHRITITVPGNPVDTQQDITDEALRQAARVGELVVPVSLLGQKEPIKLKVNGRITSTNGQPIEKAEIVMLSSDGKIEFAKTTSAADGRYELASEFRSSDGTIQIGIAASHFQSDARSINLQELQPGENTRAFDVPLTPATTIFDDILVILIYALVVILYLAGIALGYFGRPFVDRVRGKRLDNKVSVSEHLIDVSRALGDLKGSIITKSEFSQEIANLRNFVTVSLQQLPLTGGSDGSSGKSERTEKQDGNEGRDGTWYRTENYDLPKTGLEGARSSYRKLINKTLVSPDPIYLDVEGARSAGGKLQDSNTYLTQVGSSQSALVLFSDGGSIGWVFPNPKVAFRPAAIKDVFPSLSEADYETAKEEIQPMNVRRLDDGRWLVAPV